MTFFNRLTRSVLRKGLLNASTPTTPPGLKSLSLSEAETENTFLVGATSLNSSEFDRPQYSPEDILTQCLHDDTVMALAMAWDAYSKMNGSQALLIPAKDPMDEIENGRLCDA